MKKIHYADKNYMQFRYVICEIEFASKYSLIQLNNICLIEAISDLN